MFSKIINGEKFRYVNTKKGYIAYRNYSSNEEIVFDSEGVVVSNDIKTFWEGLN